MSDKIYDVIIVGGGIAGLMVAYKLQNQGLKVCILEQGSDIKNRKCPMNKECLKCNPCRIMSGYAGAGAFSDGKFIIPTSDISYGGDLCKYIGFEKVSDLVQKLDKLLILNGAPAEVYEPDSKITAECMKYDIWLQEAKIKHLGTDCNYDVMCKIIQDLNCDKQSYYRVRNIKRDRDKNIFSILVNENERVLGKKIVLATGRSGADFFEDFCRDWNIKTRATKLDIGVRIELPKVLWNHLTDIIYEPKLYYRTKTYKDIMRTFCVNPGGKVVLENTDGVFTVNGHSERIHKTDNTNFAFLNTIEFTEPFQNVTEFGKGIARRANEMSNGSVVVQRFGDLISGQRSNDKRLSESRVKPSLKAVAGDLGLVFPKRIMDNIIEGIYALDNIAKGTANYDTLLYGVEAKYYSVLPQFDEQFRVAENIWVCGDGSGVTRSLSQAGAMGLFVGEKILENN